MNRPIQQQLKGFSLIWVIIVPGLSRLSRLDIRPEPNLKVWTFQISLLPIQATIKLEDILEKPKGEVDSPVEGAAEHAHPSPAHDKGNQGGIGHLENRDMVYT